jgi:NAD(P)-dependent dehydrogenase (short-subunit alcohol dehydrogenase family)
MTIEGKAVLVTGANRGIGQALVEEALSRGAKRVYAAARQPLAHPDGPMLPRFRELSRASNLSTSSSTTPVWRFTTT